MPELKDGELILAFPQQPTKSGSPSTRNLSFLLERMEQSQALALAKMMEDYVSPMERPASRLSPSIRILKAWPTARFPLFPADQDTLFKAIKELRAAWFQQADPRLTEHKSLTVVNDDWAEFIRLMEYLSRRKYVPQLNFDALGSNPKWNSTVLKTSAKTVADLERVNALRGRAGEDDYNDALLVPLSIHLTDEEYLAKYERDLQKVLDLIHAAAVADLDAFKEMERQGRQIIEKTRPGYEKMLNRVKTLGKRSGWYNDPDNGGISFFDPRHPDFFAYKLAMVNVEMGGIPKSAYELDPTRRDKKGGPEYKLVNPRWSMLRKGLTVHDQAKLLAHLGLLSLDAMAACLAIIHIENPAINVMSLQNAVLEDAGGHSILLENTGDSEAQRLIVDKPRAHTQKSVILQGRSLDAMQCLLRWTAKYRTELKKAGDPNANKLLLFMGTHSLNFGPVGKSDVYRALIGQRIDTGDIQRLSFVERHPELEPWKSRITMAALRASAGVLAWFKCGGDEDTTRRTFGHAVFTTYLRSYIPRQIQEAMHIRMIRRFQNLLICAVCAGESYLLQATDFLTQEELHEFLSQMLTEKGRAAGNDLLDAIRKAFRVDVAPVETESGPLATISLEDQETVYLTLTVDGLAMLRLYRDRLVDSDIPAHILDTPDGKTGTKPRLWLELGNAFAQHDSQLMQQFPEYASIIDQSIKRAAELRDKVRFPELSRG